jgi:urease accessory protein
LVWREATAAPAAVMPERPRDAGWHARLELGFAKRMDKTVLAHRRHSGPLRVQKPFYPEPSGTCHVYLLHPPGGVAGGDSLELEVAVASGGQALVTTPAAGKFYRCDGRQASWRQRLAVAAGATLEWLPQETIVFDGCRAELCSRVELEAGARFIGWETLCLGRPAARERFATGRYRQCLEIWREQRPLLIERSLYEGGHELLAAAWGMQNYTVCATLFALPADKQALEQVRAGVVLEEPGLFAATLINGVLVCRYLGYQAEHARRAFCAAWHIIRPRLLGLRACEPRIWAT